MLPLVILSAAMSGCGSNNEPAVDPGPTATFTTRNIDLKKSAEARILPGLQPTMQEWVRTQEFYAELSQPEFDMLDTLRTTERISIKHGAETRLMDTLKLVIDQPWVQDGFNDDEAKNVNGLLLAYEQSLEDPYAPDIGPIMESTIRANLMQTLSLPETGSVTVLVGTDYPELGQPAFQLMLTELPKIEALVGKYPYPFLYVWVTDLGDYIAGISRDEFIGLSPDYVEAETVAHEITHATLYGLFPTWFEEGFAYFMEAYATEAIGTKAAFHKENLAAQRTTQKLDLKGKFDHERRSYTATLSQGFLFFNGLHDIEGIDGLGRIVRALRSKTYTNDNELIRAIVANSTPENQQRVQEYLCATVIGLRSGCQ